MMLPRGLALNRMPSADLVPPEPMGTHVPRIIHQTYHAAPWPEEYRANVERLKSQNSGWVYRFHDYDDRLRFIAEHYGDAVLRRYNAIDPQYGAARADLFRYLLLYKHGGVYLDMKSSTSRPLDKTLRPEDLFILSTWRSSERDDFPNWGRHPEVRHLPLGEYQQWNIITAPGHPFLKRVIEYVLRNIDTYVRGVHGVGAFAVLRVTGPIAYTLAIEPIRASAPHRLVEGGRELGLIYSIFDEDASRSHEQRFPHYAQLEVPLVKMDRWRSSMSGAAMLGRSALRLVRPAAA